MARLSVFVFTESNRNDFNVEIQHNTYFLVYIHTEYILSESISRLYFLKQLRRSGLSPSHLLHFYNLHYSDTTSTGSKRWHPTLTKSHAERLEAVQRRSLNIIYSYLHFTPYNTTLILAVAFQLYKQDVWIVPNSFFQKSLSTR